MPPAGFEPSFPASERPQTDALDDATAGVVAEWQETKIKSLWFKTAFK